MASLNQAAENYEPPRVKNISDLEVVRTDSDMAEREFTKGDGETFKMNVITVDNVEYRVPVSVLKALKEILAIKPGLKTFKVQRTGEGMNTSYIVVPLE